MGVKIVIADPKERKALQKEIEGDASKFLHGMRLGQKFSGENIDISGYEFEITGGSDEAGFPMRKGIPTERAKVLSSGSIGIKTQRAGQRIRKTVAGATVGSHTSQINVKVVKYGPEPLFKKDEAQTAEAQ